MYNIEDIKTLHLEITSKCQASCPMCARNIQGGIDNPFMVLSEITLEDFKQWFSVDFLLQLDKVFMCGNLGDPIIAKDTLEIFKYIKEINPNISLGMNTNGSARTASWWQELARLGVIIRFGIDGLADTHSVYRINTDFNKIIDNASAFISQGGYAIWDMLVFDHNRHQIDECQRLSIELGFKEFYSKNTSRFKENKLNVLDNEGKTRYVIFATDRSKEMIGQTLEFTREVPKRTIVNCKVRKEKSLYISATGNVVPCCWLDMEWMPPVSYSRIDYMDRIGRYMNLKKYSLKEIFDSGLFLEIENTWRRNPLRECAKQCGDFDKLNEQFK